MRGLLGIASLMLMGLAGCSGSAPPREARLPSRAAALPKGDLPRSVTGHGVTVEAAKKAAINKAVEVISHLMTSNELKSFKLTEDYVRKNVLVGGEPGKDLQVENIVEPFKAWVVNFHPDNDWWKDIVRRDQEAQRKLRADERQTLGSHVVIGLAFLLLAGYGYVRLDEYTQRRYTTWLRVAGIGVAATVIAGWWWVCVQAPMAPIPPG
jgi:hypothetical protein